MQNVQFNHGQNFRLFTAYDDGQYYGNKNITHGHQLIADRPSHISQKLLS